MKSYKRLYNKYRPSNWSDVIGQDSSVTIFKSCISNKTFPEMGNFILYSDIGGVGKTLIARIFAKAINCDNPIDGGPCNSCDSCKKFDHGLYDDYIELDGSKFSGVNEIKSVVELASQFPIVSGKWRIVVIDEFQRVSKAGQDTMLKQIEEGINKTIYIFCTTEFSQIRDTIRSRCFNFRINRISEVDILNRLKFICESESIKFNISDLKKIIVNSNGSLREAIKLLDMYSVAYGSIVDIPLDLKYLYIFNSLISCVVNGVYDSDQKIMQIPSDDLYVDFGRVIWDLQMFNECESTKYIDKNEIKMNFPLIKGYINRLAEFYLKYRPNTLTSIMMFLSLVFNDKKLVKIQSSDSSVGVPLNGRGRRILLDTVNKQNQKQTKESLNMNINTDIETSMEIIGFRRVE